MTFLHMLRALPLASLLLILCFLWPAAASTIIDGGAIFTAWQSYLIQLIAGVVTLLGGWVVNLLRVRIGLDIEARHRDALQTALTNAAGLAINRLGGAASGIRVDVRNAALAEAVTYVLKGTPDALRYFGLTEDRLRLMVAAKVGAVAPPAG